MSQSGASYRASGVRIAVAASIGAALFLGAIVFSWLGGVALDERGEPATAQVVSLQEGRAGGVVTATVRFTTTDGRTVTTSMRPGELAVPPPAVGATIPIVYDPQDPQAPVRDPRASREGVPGPVALLAAAVGGVGALVVLVGRWRSRRRRSDDSAAGGSRTVSG
jgi:uncharacterized protein DUF3592